MRFCVLLCAALVAACGSNSDPTDTTAEATPTATPTASLADQDAAMESGLELEDFPSDWEQDGEGPGTAGDCEPVGAAQELATVNSTARRFSRELLRAESTVLVFADEAAAQEGYGQLTSAASGQCLADAITAGVGSDPEAEVGQAQISDVAVEPHGDEAHGKRVSVPVKSRAAEVEINAEVVVARAGRGVAMLTFVNPAEPFDERLRERLTKAVVERVDEAL